jgi:hypothetical protein
MAKMVLGVFNDEVNAQDALSDLEAKGYNPKDISIVMKDRARAEAFADDTGTDVAGGAVSGAVTGGVLGALAGLLMATGVIPGLGILLIGGPLAAAFGLTGAAATTVAGATTGAVAGGLIGALMSLGLPEEDAKVYEQSIQAGGILLAVPTKRGEEEEVRAILENFGADQVRAISSEEGYTRREEGAPEYAPAYFSEVDREGDEDDGEALPRKRRVRKVE